MTDTEVKERTTRCGFCLSEHPISEVLQHGLNVCNSSTQPFDVAGSELLEIWYDRIAGHDSGWPDVLEKLAYDMSSDYEEISDGIAEGGEIAERAEDRMFQIEDRAARAMTINFVKRLCFAANIKIEDLLS